ncbi:HIN_023833 [Hexamita inflata]|uniref:HIN_006121 n=1 Tax=Hexamita inflata TaxID=28002 RepID=A0ABP1HX13_9EUKA
MSGLSLKFKQVVNNPVLQRTQCIVNVYHTGKHYGKLEDVRAVVCQKFKVADPKCVTLYGFETRFGGDVSTGFCCIYKNIEALKNCEPAYRQIRSGIKDKKKPLARKSIKTGKNKALKRFGTHVKKEVTKKR